MCIIDPYMSMSEIKDLITIVTLILGSYVALRGLSAWKNQFKSHEYNIAKSILISLYKYREEINALRHPAIWTYEYPPAERHSAIERENKNKKMLYVYQKRLNKVTSLKPDLYEFLIESEVLWGKDLRKIFEKIFRLEFKVSIEINNYLTSFKNPHEEKVTFDRAYIYDSLNDDTDHFRKLFNPLLVEVENYLKPKLKL